MKNIKVGESHSNKPSNIPSREVTPQPLLKFSLGPGNNFIVKNSNILIQQNTIKKNAQFQGNEAPLYAKEVKTQSKLNHQRAYSLEQKSRIYGSKMPQFNSVNTNQSAFQNNQISGSRNQNRFNPQVQSNGKVNNSMNTQLFPHQQRKINYSPIQIKTQVNNPKAGQKLGSFASEEDQTSGPHRRAYSKNEKYNDNGLTDENFHNSQFDKKHRFSPLTNTKSSSQSKQKSQNESNRPSSATLKKKDQSSNKEELSQNLRLLLQQNVSQNKENKRLFQQKIGKKHQSQKTSEGLGTQEDILNSLFGKGINQNGVNFKQGSANSRIQGIQNKKGENPDSSTRNIERAMQAYNTQKQKKAEMTQIGEHKRSQSNQNPKGGKTMSNFKQLLNQTSNESNSLMLSSQKRGQSNSSKNRQGQQRPKSNLDMIEKQEKQKNEQIFKQSLNDKNQERSHSQTGNYQPKLIETKGAVNEEQKNQEQAFSFYTANPQQMYTNCVTKFAFATKTGMAPSNPNKVNQDNWITVPHFCGLKYLHFFSVCDGHGQFGREVSTILKNRLPQYLEHEMRYVFLKSQEFNQQNQVDQPLNTDEICIAFNNAFLDANEELFSGILDIRFSGSTCVSLITLGQKLFCSNVGDSRAIVVKKTEDNQMIAQAISRDQKPCQADEAERILKCGGRIDSFRDPDRNPIGPLRVWLKHEDIPGLAMTRSFGDEVAGRVGVTAEPEILELDLCKDDKFIVLASDGVWEFITNEEVAQIVMPFFEKRNAEGAAESLVRESYLRWKHEEDEIIDDITCVIIFLDVKLPQQAESQLEPKAT